MSTGLDAVRASVLGAPVVGGFAEAPRADGKWPASWRCSGEARAALEAACTLVHEAGSPKEALEATGRAAAQVAPLVKVAELSLGHVEHCLRAVALAARVPVAKLDHALRIGLEGDVVALPAGAVPDRRDGNKNTVLSERSASSTTGGRGRRPKKAPPPAVALWEAAGPLDEPGRAYLARWGAPPLDTLRSARIGYRLPDGGELESPEAPCLLAPVHIGGVIVAVFLTWLNEQGVPTAPLGYDGQPLVDDMGQPVKATTVIGPWQGCVVRLVGTGLGAFAATRRLTLTTTLGAGLSLVGPRGRNPVWVALAAHNLPRVTIPASVMELVLAVPAAQSEALAPVLGHAREVLAAHGRTITLQRLSH